MIDDEYILSEFLNSIGNFNEKRLKHINDEEKEYLLTRYSDSKSFKETINRIKYGIEIRPVCSICGQPVKFIGRKNVMFANTCCSEHRKILQSKNIKETLLSFSAEKRQSVQAKMKKTKLEMYGDENYNNRDKFKKTCNIKFNGNAPACDSHILEKMNITVQSKYGVDNIAQLPTNNFKSNNPQKILRIREKTKQTNIKKYGGNSPTCSSKIREKQQKTAKENHKKTRFENFVYIKSLLNNYPLFSNDMKNKICLSIDNIYEKQLNDSICSFKTSIEEDLAYLILQIYFKDILRQYRSLEYPYFCDFYIPSIDTYIECNFYWTHGFHPFDYNSKKDNDKLNFWKSKHSKFYESAIKTWTTTDVEKRKIAEKNNLHYIEFWNLQDVINYVNTLNIEQ